MIFRNPWAWLGLIAVSGPLLAHLLARRQAKRQPFPNLRFLPGGIQRPISLNRPTDLILLFVRLSIVSLAVAALAQPLWLSSARVEQLGGELARAIIVDSRAGNAAKTEAARLKTESTSSRIVETPRPAQLIAGAVQWLSAQSMRRELVVISDFQTGTLARTTLDQVPAHIGLQMVPVAGAAAPISKPLQSRSSVTLLAGSNELAGAEAARAAAISQGAPAEGTFSAPVAILFPGYERREALLKTSREIDQPWMFEAFADIADNRIGREAAERTGKQFHEVVSAVAGTVEGAEALILVTQEPAHSLFAAALISSVARASDPRRFAAAAGVTSVSPEELRNWNRSAEATAPANDQVPPDESHGRWLWVGVLVLLTAEAVVRRRQRNQSVKERDAIAA